MGGEVSLNMFMFNLKLYKVARMHYMAQLLLKMCFTVMYKMHKNV